ncbi:protein Mis18-alpha-like isoform X2 [Dendrobates tinctorius]|uniref:protein Mis18-alpha-like isoform X2 n=1 Tax=Dendrobates tinctorius TaxID=92724 RepID=UPI003CCA3185
MAHSWSSGYEDSGTSDSEVAGTSDSEVAGTSSFQVVGTSSFQVARISSFQVAGRSDSEVAGRSDSEVAGTSYSEVAGTSSFHVAMFQRDNDLKTLYLCKQCRLPVGDSGDGTDVFCGGNFIYLKAVTQFVKRGKLSRSSDRHDADSRYQTLSCTKCCTILGRFYHSTPRDQKHKLNQFTIDKKVISVYHFGENLQQSIPVSEAPITLETSQGYLDQIEKQKALLEVLQRRLTILKEKVSSEQNLDSSL